MSESILLEDIAKKLEPMSWDILQILNKTEYMNWGQIYEKFGRRQGKVDKEIARLEGALLIEYSRDDYNQKKKNYKITQHGMDILKYRK